MKTTRNYAIIILLVFAYQAANSQSRQAMYYLNFPRSVSSVGLGEQGVTSWNSADALTYNPANLIYSKNMELSYFRDPFYSYGWYFPVTSFNLSFEIPNVGYFGFEYLNWNLERTFRLPLGVEESPTSYSYQRSFSIGYAREFSEKFAAGIQIRYAIDKFSEYKWDKFLFSVGLNYNPDALDKRLTLGFSLTNFGTAIEYDYGQLSNEIVQKDPPPSVMRLGVDVSLIRDSFQQLTVDFQLTKIFDERDANFQGQSSFKTLFTDWNEFPEDVTVHKGIAFKWLPLSLGNGFSFFQEMFLGNISDFYTHGSVIGIGYNGIQASIGYAGWWHNINRQNYLPLLMPRETFQFAVSVAPQLVFRNTEETNPSQILDKIILSAGSAYTLRIGRSKEYHFNYWGTRSKNSFSYSVESDFYIDKNNALVSSFTYQSVPVEYSGFWFPTIYKTKNENLMFSSSYRIHPTETFQPFYIQGGLGIIRINPVVNTHPKYDYRTYVTAGVGVLVELTEKIYLKPAFNFLSMFSEVSGTSPRLGDFNQFDITLRLGYRVK